MPMGLLQIAPEDIEQGQLGDCWLLAALACMGKRRGALRSVFATQCYNRYGKYQVWLWKDGRRHLVTVDDRIPVSAHGEPLFAKVVGENQMWVSAVRRAAETPQSPDGTPRAAETPQSPDGTPR